MACISAPIFDGRGGLAGVLDASSRSSVRQQHTAALVQMSATNIENSLIRAGHDRKLVLQFHPRAEYLGTLSVGMLVLDEDFTVHAVNHRGEIFLAGLPRILGAPFGAIFDQPFESLALRLVQGETLRLRDRLGSVLSVRCVANRASFAMAARIATTAPGLRRAGSRMPPAEPGDAHAARARAAVIEDRRLIAELRRLVATVQRGVPALMRGEAGTGKEVLARLAHAAADRRGRLVAVDTRIFAAGDADLAFFGHPQAAPGLFDEAAGGTLFVEEVTRLSLPVQAALVRILDLGEYRRPSDGALRTCTLSLVASTQEDLDAAHCDGRLLAGLRYRLESAVITLPPLRERDDLEALARHFAREVRPDCALAPEATALLQRHDWPGNLRELRAVLVRAAARAQAATITAADVAPFLPPRRHGGVTPEACPHCAGIPWKEDRCRAIRAAVARCGSVTGAARDLGMSRTTVHRNMSRDNA